MVGLGPKGALSRKGTGMYVPFIAAIISHQPPQPWLLVDQPQLPFAPRRPLPTNKAVFGF